MRIKSALFIFAALLFSGCHSDLYYQNQAVGRAREFLLQESADLTPEQVNFVRFNSPVLLHAPVLGSIDGKSVPYKLAHEQHQVCVTWIIPGKDDLYMVYGVSSARMSDWYPERVIKRTYRSNQAVIPQAAAKCISYAQANFYGSMTPEEINKMRFSMPYLYHSKFELNFDPAGKADAAALDELRRNAAGKYQYALVWKMRDRNLVFAGLGDKGFKKWDIMMAGFFSDRELETEIGMQLMTPEDYTKPFPAEKEENK